MFKKTVFAVLFLFLPAFCVLQIPATAQDQKPDEPAVPDAMAEDDAGPFLLDPTKQPKVVEGETAKPVIDFNKLKNIDIEKEPWLVESAGLTPGHPALRRDRMIWADSWLYADVPEIDIEHWVGDAPPDLAGKFVLIEVWATWCPPCRRSLPYLNYLHEKYGEQLVVVAICETDKAALEEMERPLKLADIKFYNAVDTGRRFANKLGVYGIPHTVILDPQFGAVIWEGMPTQPGHELTPEKIEKILAIGKKLEAAGQLPKESPVKFQLSEATEKVVRPQRATP